jgi:hypothetical protein
MRRRLGVFTAVLALVFVVFSGSSATAATFSSVSPIPQNNLAGYASTQTYGVTVQGASATTVRCLAAHFTYTSITLPDPSATEWQLAGGATTDGSNITLTTPQQNFAGTSAVYNSAMPVNGLTATFDGYMGNGGGADGMTFAFLDATSWSGYAGATGGGLGYSGLNGVAVTMDTMQNGSDPNNNFVGIATSGSGSNITYAATSTAVPALRNTLRHYEITATSNSVTVKVDGVQYLSQTVTLPAMVLPAFTAGTGGLSDLHEVRNISITSTGAGPAGTANYKPAGMTTSGPTLTGSTAVNGGNWALASTTGDRLTWTYATGEIMTGGTVFINNISKNPTVPGAYHLRIETFSDTGCSSMVDSGYGSFSLVSHVETVELGATINPSLTFSVAGYNAGTCNGATITGTSSTGTLVPLGRPTIGANAVAGQTLQVSTNASRGFYVTARYTDALRDTTGTRTLANWSGTNGTPTAFPSPGTEAVGYTTDDTLSGSATRFQTNKWAGLSTSAQQVAYSATSTTADTIHVCYQAGISSFTAAGSYSTTVIYTAVATY